MNQGIDVTAIKNGLVSGFEFISAKAVQLKDAVGDLAGRTVTVVKSGVEKALPYLQNPTIAAVSTFAVSYISLEIGDRIGGLVGRLLPNNTEGQHAFREVAGSAIGLAVWIGGVVAFSRYALLPLSPLAITGLVVAFAIVRAQFG